MKTAIRLRDQGAILLFGLLEACALLPDFSPDEKLEYAIFCDRSGAPIAFVERGDIIYLSNGEPVADIVGSSVYLLSGKHVGWYDSGWVRDHEGKAVLFCRLATGIGPRLPPTKDLERWPLKKLSPLRGLMEFAPSKPMPSPRWSNLSGETFFK